jgi:hypothetical protein
MIIDNLSFKMIHKEELINLGNVEFIKKYFDLNDEKFINNMILFLYNDLKYDELYTLLINLKEKFLKKLYEFKNELNLNENDFLLFNHTINLDHIRQNINNSMDLIMENSAKIDEMRFKFNTIIRQIEEVDNTNIEKLNENLYLISEAIHKPLYHLEKINNGFNF